MTETSKFNDRLGIFLLPTSEQASFPGKLDIDPEVLLVPGTGRPAVQFPQIVTV